jgi:carbonic anhydrase
VIRNAGGRVVDAMRSINALDAIGNMGTLIVVHHTGMSQQHPKLGECRCADLVVLEIDCGMTHMPDANVRKMLKARTPELSEEIDGMTFGEIKE